MMQSNVQFRIDQYRKENLNHSVESLAVFVLALFLTVFLPQLLFKYFYADQQLLEEPALLSYIPVVSFVLGVGYFLYAMIGNLLRMRKIRQLEKELAMTEVVGSPRSKRNELAEVEKLADAVITQKRKKKTTRKATK